MKIGKDIMIAFNDTPCVKYVRNGNVCEQPGETISLDHVTPSCMTCSTEKRGNRQQTSSTMSDTIDLVSTNHVGCREGTPFADSPPSGHLFTSTINKIAIRAASNVLSLRVLNPLSLVVMFRDLTLHIRLGYLRVE